MLSDHESVAIAQTIFYVPIVPITIFLLVKNWPIGARLSRVLWYTLALFSLMRLAGGILVIATGSNSNSSTGLTIATIVLLNVGLVPLILSTFGMIGIIITLAIEKNNSITMRMIIIRFVFITAVSFLVTGAGLSLSGHEAGDILVKTAYILYAVIILIMISIILHLRCSQKKLATASLIYLHGITFAIPCLILRILYAALGEFATSDTFSPLDGSVVAFALMALLPEYITTAIYVRLGFHRVRENAVALEDAAIRSNEAQSHALVEGRDMVQG